MISVWKQKEGGFVPLENPEPGAWLNVTGPNNYEISRLINEFALPADILSDILDSDEQARVEHEDGRLLFIVRSPVFDAAGETPYSTVPVGIIFFNSMVMTVCLRENEIIGDMLSGRGRRFSIQDCKTFLLAFFSRVSFYFLRHLKDINRRTTLTERELQKSVKNTELIHLLTLEKSLVFFTTSLKSNEFLIDRICKSNILRLSGDEADLLDDVVTENRQAIEMANIYSNILSGMMDAFASVISNNLNVVMKHLTSISLILMLPTLIASIYGMNVALPFQDSPFAFLATLGVSAVFASVSILIFWRKQYF